jgi:hypothetical protein
VLFRSGSGEQRELGWNGPARIEVSTREDGWSVEMAFSLEKLGLPADAKQIKFNLARGRVRQEKLSRSYWQPLLDHDELAFGALALKSR